MPERTTSSLVTFLHPFSLAGVEEEQPAGAYTIEAVDEQLETLSFICVFGFLVLVIVLG